MDIQKMRAFVVRGQREQQVLKKLNVEKGIMKKKIVKTRQRKKKHMTVNCEKYL